jgi:uncharacterized HAD superfamily protein
MCRLGCKHVAAPVVVFLDTCMMLGAMRDNIDKLTNGYLSTASVLMTALGLVGCQKKKVWCSPHFRVDLAQT